METKIKEIWKDVVGYEGLYEVSSIGRVKSLNYNGTKKPKILAKIYHHTGYICTGLYANRKNKWVYVHQLVAIAFIPNPNGYDQVNHINSNKSDPRLENLEWCNQSQNRRHAQESGFVNMPKGEDVYISKLKNSDISEIFRLRSVGFSQKRIGEKYNVSRQTIGNLLSGKTWKHIKRPLI